MMRRERLMRDTEFTGFRVVAERKSRDGNQLDDFLDKNHIPHRVIPYESDEGLALVPAAECESPRPARF